MSEAERYAEAAGLAHPISPHRLRHFLLTWLKKQGIDDALIQPYSGHASRKSLETYSQLAIGEAQLAYDGSCRGSPSSRTGPTLHLVARTLIPPLSDRLDGQQRSHAHAQPRAARNLSSLELHTPTALSHLTIDLNSGSCSLTPT